MRSRHVPLRHRALCACLLAGLLVPAGAGATSIAVRTGAVSVGTDGRPAAGDSLNPAASSDARVVAFDTTATNIGPVDPNGAIRDVVTVNLLTGARRIVSDPGGGVVADGPSSAPVLGRGGEVVVFVSEASTLVPGDTNGVADVFARDGDGAIERLSVSTLGVEANGPSGAPDVSADGRFVVFTTDASNLVPGDANAASDVVVHDRARRTTTLVSIGTEGTSGTGRSSTPAISAGGEFVTFESAAADLVFEDDNGVPDAFLRNIFSGQTTLVSVSSDGIQQAQALAPAFRQITDVSADGRYVVFDSDADNLTTNDTNSHTDVFLRDRRTERTRLISASTVNVQGNNDSYAPTLTPNGRHLVFRSYATNLVRGDAPGEDLVIRDLRTRTTSTVDVPADGARRSAEATPLRGRRAAVTDDGRTALFASVSTNLVAGDANGATDVFARRLDPPETRLVSRTLGSRPVIRLAADDKAVDRYVCRLDAGRPFMCGATTRLPAAARGAQRLTVRAGGPGLLYDPSPLTVRLSSERTRPTVRIRKPTGRSLRVISGTASDRSGIRRVEVSVAYLVAGGCEHLRQRAGRLVLARASCTRKFFVPATGGRAWSVRLPRAVKGAFRIIARATDNAGNRSRSTQITAVLG